jgi:hypothetical protein
MAPYLMLQTSTCIPVRPERLSQEAPRELHASNRDLAHLHPPAQSVVGDLDLDTAEGQFRLGLWAANNLMAAIYGR